MEKPRILVFDRSPVARLVSCAGAFSSAALLFAYLAQPPEDVEGPWVAALAALVLATLLAAVVQYGDRIYLSDRGVMAENRFLSRLGRHGHWVAWEDIVEIREIRERVLILLSRDGRRVLIDAILGYSIARSEILRRAPQAIVSGTLVQDDR